MATATVQTLLTRTKEAAEKRADVSAARYAKLVRRAAEGDNLDPDNVLQSLAALRVDPVDFAEDVEYAAARIELKAVADQLPARTAAKNAARQALEAADAEYAAERRKLDEHHGAKIATARKELDQAAGQEQRAEHALRELARTCRDTETQERAERVGKEMVDLRVRIAAINADSAKWEDKAWTAERIERQEAAAMPLGHTTPDTPGARDRRETIALAPQIVASNAAKIEPLRARLAELAAEEAALSARILEPWPVDASPRG